MVIGESVLLGGSAVVALVINRSFRVIGFVVGFKYGHTGARREILGKGSRFPEFALIVSPGSR